MVGRLLTPSNNSSFFIFGPRGSGKSTLLRSLFPSNTNTFWIDFLKAEDEERFRDSPDSLSAILKKEKYPWVIIDEVQKVPKILDLVHLEIEKKQTRFVLTGSSARKLKRGAANLLAGRAFTYHLFPLCHSEYGEGFDLQQVLRFGALPGLLEIKEEEDKNEFLRSYVRTYLKEEIVAEQILRKIDPFRDFLKIAAQCNGEVVNYSKIATDVGVDDKTIQSYFLVLEETLVGHLLPSYHRSIRKQQREAPKFYLFDLGVKRALEQSLKSEVSPGTYSYGKNFEHFLILEAIRLNEYFRLDFSFSYLRTKDSAEVDLVIERPGEKDLLVDIKSKTKINPSDVKHLESFAKDWKKPVETALWSQDSLTQKIQNTNCFHWTKGLIEAGFTRSL